MASNFAVRWSWGTDSEALDKSISIVPTKADLFNSSFHAYNGLSAACCEE